MNQVQETARNASIAILFAAFCFVSHAAVDSDQGKSSIKIGPVMVHRAMAFDVLLHWRRYATLTPLLSRPTVRAKPAVYLPTTRM